MNRKPFFVVNPHAGSATTGRLWAGWREAIRRHIGSADYAFTAGAMDGLRLTREALAKGYDLVVAVGGDGTLNEVLNGFFESGKPLCPGAAIGYLPNGTGADFSRTIGVYGVSPDELAERMARCSVRQLDCGEVRFHAASGQETRRLFANESSLGFSARTAAAVNQARKRFRGRLPFLIGVVRCLSSLGNPVLEVKVDGRSVYRGPTLMIAVANGRYFGGGMMIAPDAVLDDGQLDVIIVSAMSRLTLLRKIPKIYSGRHLEEPEVKALRCHTVEVTADGADVALEMDGEQPGRLSAQYSISKLTVPFLC